jgi:hypothetical protein
MKGEVQRMPTKLKIQQKKFRDHQIKAMQILYQNFSINT